MATAFQKIFSTDPFHNFPLTSVDILYCVYILYTFLLKISSKWQPFKSFLALHHPKIQKIYTSVFKLCYRFYGALYATNVMEFSCATQSRCNQ